MSNIRQLLTFHDIAPKKSLGQNFCHDPNTLNNIAQVAGIDPDATVLEIGTGTGTLTKILAERAARVITCEVDDRLMPILRQEITPLPNVELHFQDILEADISALIGDSPYHVVGNLPYYITSAIMRKILETTPKPKSVTVMVQREVAERMIAKPPNMSVLTVSIQFYGNPKIMMKVSPNVFYPRPDVGSAVVHLEIFPSPQIDVPDEQQFFSVVRAGFSQKRKQIKNSLANGLGIDGEDVAEILTKANIEAKRRAETLTLEEWAALSRAYVEN